MSSRRRARVGYYDDEEEEPLTARPNGGRRAPRRVTRSTADAPVPEPAPAPEPEPEPPSTRATDYLASDETEALRRAMQAGPRDTYDASTDETLREVGEVDVWWSNIRLIIYRELFGNMYLDKLRLPLPDLWMVRTLDASEGGTFVDDVLSTRMLGLPLAILARDVVSAAGGAVVADDMIVTRFDEVVDATLGQTGLSGGIVPLRAPFLRAAEVRGMSLPGDLPPWNHTGEQLDRMYSKRPGSSAVAQRLMRAPFRSAIETLQGVLRREYGDRLPPILATDEYGMPTRPDDVVATPPARSARECAKVIQDATGTINEPVWSDVENIIRDIGGDASVACAPDDQCGRPRTACFNSVREVSTYISHRGNSPYAESDYASAIALATIGAARVNSTEGEQIDAEGLIALGDAYDRVYGCMQSLSNNDFTAHECRHMRRTRLSLRYIDSQSNDVLRAVCPMAVDSLQRTKKSDVYDICGRLAMALRVAADVYERLHAADSDEIDTAARYVFDADIGPARTGDETTLTNMMYDTRHTGQALQVGVARAFKLSMLLARDPLRLQRSEYVINVVLNDETSDHVARERADFVAQYRTIFESEFATLDDDEVIERMHQAVVDADAIEILTNVLKTTMEQARRMIITRLSQRAPLNEALAHDPVQRGHLARAIAAILRRGRMRDTRMPYKARRMDNEYDLKEAVVQIGMRAGIVREPVVPRYLLADGIARGMTGLPTGSRF